MASASTGAENDPFGDTPTSPTRERQLPPATPFQETKKDLARITNLRANPKDATGLLNKAGDLIRDLLGTTANQRSKKKVSVESDTLQDLLALIATARRAFHAEHATALQFSSLQSTVIATNEAVLALETQMLEIATSMDHLLIRQQPPPPPPETYAGVASNKQAPPIGQPKRRPRLSPQDPETGLFRNTQTPDRANQIVVNQLNRDDPVFKTAEAKDVLEKVNAAIREAGIKGPDGEHPVVTAAKQLRSKDFALQARSEDEAKLLRGDSSWLNKIAPDALRVQRPTLPIFVHRVPTSLDPTNAATLAKLRDDNPHTLSSLSKVMWARPRDVHPETSKDAPQPPQKRYAGLIIHLHDTEEANKALMEGITIEAHSYHPEMARRPVIQCRKCFRFGHTQKWCKAKEQKCGNCSDAGHATADCPCSNTPPCEDLATCEHIIAKRRCINCKGEHASTHPQCPTRVEHARKINEAHFGAAPAAYDNADS